MNKVLITGANRGIGLELCRQLSIRGDEIVAICRQASSELRSLNLRIIEGVDVNAFHPGAVKSDLCTRACVMIWG